MWRMSQDNFYQLVFIVFDYVYLFEALALCFAPPNAKPVLSVAWAFAAQQDNASCRNHMGASSVACCCELIAWLLQWLVMTTQTLQHQCYPSTWSVQCLCFRDAMHKERPLQCPTCCDCSRAVQTIIHECLGYRMRVCTGRAMLFVCVQQFGMITREHCQMGVSACTQDTACVSAQGVVVE